MTKRRATLIAIGILILAIIGYLVYRQWFDPNRPHEGLPRELEVAGIMPNQPYFDIPGEVRDELKTDGVLREWPDADWERLLGVKHCPLLEKRYDSEHIEITTTQLNPDYVADCSDNEAMLAELGIEFVRSIRLLDNTYATSKGLRIGDDKARFESLYQRTYETEHFTYETIGSFQLLITVADGIVTEIRSANFSAIQGTSYM